MAEDENEPTPGEDEPSEPQLGSTRGSKATTETVTLRCQHTHNRVVRQAGERITVAKATAENLRAQGVCK